MLNFKRDTNFSCLPAIAVNDGGSYVDRIDTDPSPGTIAPVRRWTLGRPSLDIRISFHCKEKTQQTVGIAGFNTICGACSV